MTPPISITWIPFLPFTFLPFVRLPICFAFALSIQQHVFIPKHIHLARSYLFLMFSISLFSSDSLIQVDHRLVLSDLWNTNVFGMFFCCARA